MKEAPTFNRLAAYIIDIVIIGILVSLITMGIPKSKKYEDASEKIDTLLERYINNEPNNGNIIDELYENKYIMSKESIADSLISVVLGLGMFVGFAYYNKGQTVGKKLLHIRVVSNEGNDASYRQLLARGLLFDGAIFEILSIITILFIKSNQYLYTIGIMEYLQGLFVICSFIMISYRKDKRALHDLICKTKVVEC